MEIPRYGLIIGLVRRKEKPVSIADRLLKAPTKERLMVGAGVLTVGALSLAAWNRMPSETRSMVGTLTEGAYQRLTVLVKAGSEKINQIKTSDSEGQEFEPHEELRV